MDALANIIPFDMSKILQAKQMCANVLKTPSMLYTRVYGHVNGR